MPIGALKLTEAEYTASQSSPSTNAHPYPAGEENRGAIAHQVATTRTVSKHSSLTTPISLNRSAASTAASMAMTLLAPAARTATDQFSPAERVSPTSSRE